jgi:hypothetical protein
MLEDSKGPLISLLWFFVWGLCRDFNLHLDPLIGEEVLFSIETEKI